MAAFGSGEVSLSAATATKIVDAAEFDRRVIAHGDTVRVAFTSGSASTGAKISDLSPTNTVAVFALPAGQELWVYSSSPSIISYLVTNTA